MEKFRAVLLNVRREACRHIEISESTERIAATLTRDIPIDRVLAALRSARVSDPAETPALGAGLRPRRDPDRRSPPRRALQTRTGDLRAIDTHPDHSL